MLPSIAEYIWIDGAKPVQALRSKTRVVELNPEVFPSPEDFPDWSFDGSSTYQSKGHQSDLILKPVRVLRDPFRGHNHFLVLCEVYEPGNVPHVSNIRAQLRAVLNNGGASYEPWVGFEQEYTFFDGTHPLGWPVQGYPKPQGPFYCGVGANKVFGREIVEEHLKYCLDAGLLMYGINAEVMPSQWEYQVGYRGFQNDVIDALLVCDHQWLARWLLCRTAEKYNVTVSFDNKPIKGDWNGAGCHTNFSTKEMRSKEQGIHFIRKAIQLLSRKHLEHIAIYGHGLEERLTGLHETCAIHEFRSGVSDRGASIRIPLQVEKQGYGYLEDRRPGANSDPYLVTMMLIKTTCEISETCEEELNQKTGS